MFILFKSNYFLNHFGLHKCSFSSRTNSILNGFTAAIGNTPLVKLEKISNQLGSKILVKCEYMNPGGKIINCPIIY